MLGDFRFFVVVFELTNFEFWEILCFVSTRTAAELKSEVEHDNRRATRPTQPVHARRRSGKELTAPDKFYLPVDATPQPGGALRALHSSVNARSFSKPGELLRAGSDRLVVFVFLRSFVNV